MIAPLKRFLDLFERFVVATEKRVKLYEMSLQLHIDSQFLTEQIVKSQKTVAEAQKASAQAVTAMGKRRGEEG